MTELYNSDGGSDSVFVFKSKTKQLPSKMNKNDRRKTKCGHRHCQE